MNKTIVVIKNNVRIYVSDLTQLAQEAMDAHQTLPLPSLALSTAIAVFGTFGNIKKGIHTSVNLKGNGPLKNIIVETTGDGGLRALIGNPFVATELDKNGFNNIPISLGVGGGGFLKVIHISDKINFGGEVPLAKGNITTDLAYYFDQSEQIFSAVISSVKLEKKDKLKHAKAVIFQVLPKHNEEDLKWIEDFIKNNKLSNLSIDECVKLIDGKVLETLNLKWKCNCSKEKMENVFNTLGKKEKEEIIKKEGFVEVTCNFCKKSYKFK